MGSILIRKVPDGVHRKFKQVCRARKVSMEETIVRLIAREVGEGRRGRPRTIGSKRRAVRRVSKKSPRTTAHRSTRRRGAGRSTKLR